MAEVVVIGRVGTDFPPDATGVALEDVRTFTRCPGGYGGNVGTGLGRLGVDAAVVATVGDDGHGRFLRAFLAREGVDVSALRAGAALRTALAFYEAWPPDRFPVDFFPSKAYWALERGQVTPEMVGSPVLLVSAVAMAEDPSRDVVLEALHDRAELEGRTQGTTIVDLDWRPMLWADQAGMEPLTLDALRLADAVIGSEAEFAALHLDPVDLASVGYTVWLKRGEHGARYLAGSQVIDVPPVRVQTVCGIGSGDAFAAAVGEGLVRGRDPETIVRRANAAGAIVATRIATSDAMPTNTEIEELLR